MVRCTCGWSDSEFSIDVVVRQLAIYASGRVRCADESLFDLKKTEEKKEKSLFVDGREML